MKQHEHSDGRLCRYMAYALDRGPTSEIEGLRYGWFFNLPPDMRMCHRDHPEPAFADDGDG